MVTLSIIICCCVAAAFPKASGAGVQTGDRRLRSRHGPTTGGLTSSMTFIGFDTAVPPNTTLKLSFVPSFGADPHRHHRDPHHMVATAQPAAGEGSSSVDGLSVTAVFTSAGRAVIIDSACGRYSESERIFRAKVMCVRAVVKGPIEQEPRSYMAAVNVHGPDGATFVPAGLSATTVHFNATTMLTPHGFYFAIVSSSQLPVTLQSIRVTGADLKEMTSWPDVTLPPAEPVAT